MSENYLEYINLVLIIFYIVNKYINNRNLYILLQSSEYYEYQITL